MNKNRDQSVVLILEQGLLSGVGGVRVHRWFMSFARPAIAACLAAASMDNRQVHDASSEPPERDRLLYEPDMDSAHWFTGMVDKVAASCGSDQQKMLVLFVDGEVRMIDSMVSVDKWDRAGGAKELLQTETAQFIPLTMPPFTDKKYRDLYLLCDEDAYMKPQVRINDVASRLLGAQVSGGVLRGTVIVAGADGE